MPDYFSFLYMLRIIAPIILSYSFFKAVREQSWSKRFSVFHSRVLSCMVFLIMPTLYSSKSYVNLFGASDKKLQTLLITVMFALLALAAARFSFKLADLKTYPQHRAIYWSTSLVLMNCITWIVYLVGYEFFFRGFLLFSMAEMTPQPWAIVLNILLYSAVHLPKGWKETLLAIPFGVLLCWVTIYTGTLWAAIIIHGTLAVTTELTAIHFCRIHIFKLHR